MFIRMTLIFLLLLAGFGSAAQAQDVDTEGVLEGAARLWVGMLENPEDEMELASSVIVMIQEMESEQDAEASFTDMVAELTDTELPDGQSIEPESINLPGSNAAAFLYLTPATPEIGAAYTYMAFFQEDHVFYTVYTSGMAGPGEEHGDYFADQHRMAAESIASEVFSTPASSYEAAKSDDYWSGGIWDRFPSAESHPVPGASLLSVEEQYANNRLQEQQQDLDTEAPASRSGDAVTTDSGWIAVSETDGLYILSISGEEKHLLAEGMFRELKWSYDGEMIAAVRGEWEGIVIYKDGALIEITDTQGCSLPTFTWNAQRVLYTCWSSDLVPSGQDNPVAGSFLVSSALDGTDQRVERATVPEMSYEIVSEMTGDLMPTAILTSTGYSYTESYTLIVEVANETSFNRTSVGELDISQHQFILTFNAEFSLVRSASVSMTLEPETRGPFLVTGATISRRPLGLIQNENEIMLVSLERTGVTSSSYQIDEPNLGYLTAVQSPDGSMLLLSNLGTEGGVYLRTEPDVPLTQISSGSHAVWQPIPHEIILP